MAVTNQNALRKKREEKEKQEAAKSAPAAQSPTQAKGPSAPTVEKTDKGVRVSAGPTSRPLTQKQSLLLNQRKAVRNTQYRIEEPGQIGELPEVLEPHREMLQRKNDVGEMMASSVHPWATNTIDVNMNSIKDENQLFYFGTTLEDDDQRELLYKNYAKSHRINVDDLYYRAETALGKDAFGRPKSSYGRLNAIGLYNPDGTALDPATANQAQMTQAIRRIPEGKEHDEAEAIYARLYGKPEKGYLDFVDSAYLTQTEYNAAVKDMDASFTISDGASQENIDAYLENIDDILMNYEDPVTQRYMLSALKNSYELHTGVEAPDEEELRKVLNEGQTQDSEEDGGEPGILERIAGGFAAAGERLSSAFSGKRPVPKPADVTAYGAAGQEEEAREATQESSGGGASSVPASSYAAAGDSEILRRIAGEDAAQETAAEAIAGQTVGDQVPPVQGPVQQKREEAEAQSSDQTLEKYGNRVAYNPEMTDEEALALHNSGAVLDDRNYEQIKWFVENRNAQGLVNGITGSMYGDLGRDEQGRRNVINTFDYYGSSIAAAAMSSANLPDDMANLSALELGRIVAEIDGIVADPRNAITVPKGQNMYEYVLSLPQYEGLSARVESVSGALARVNEVQAEQAQKAKEARERLLESDKAQILAGNGTPEMAQRVADAYSGDYVDTSDDELLAIYRAQMRETGSYFSDGGTFWSGGSAAAVEGANMRKLGSGYGLFKSGLKDKTMRVLDEYASAAANLGMNLEGYLGHAGIDSLDQVIDIAYNEMLSEGKAYAADTEAQQATEQMATTSLGLISALAAGGRQGAESYAADFMQTAYMAVSALDYEQNKLSIQDEYNEKYGSRMAAAMYYADLMAYIDSGTLSEESANDLLDHMRQARSIFDVAYEIDAGFLTGLARTGREELQKDVEELSGVIAQLPPDERAAANFASGVTYSLPGMAVASMTGKATGSALIGSAVAWGMPEYSSAYDENRAAGMSPGMAAWAAFGNGIISTLVNMGGTGTQMELLWGDAPYAAFKDALTSKGGRGLMKEMAKYVGQRGIEEGTEEIVEFGLGTAYDLLDKEFLDIEKTGKLSVVRTLDHFIEGLREEDYAALAKEAMQNFGVGFVMGGIFSVIGASKTAYSTVKGAKMQGSYASVNLAVQMADGNAPFTEENIGKVISSLKTDLQDPRFRRWLDSRSAAALDQNATLTAMMTGTGETERKAAVELAQRASEYEDKASAARSASDTAKSRWIELRQRAADGDMSMVPAMESARMQWQRAETTYQETDNAAQKAREKAKQKTSEWLRTCRTQGTTMKSAMLERHADQVRSALDSMSGRQEQANTAAVEMETFIDERYPEADEETRSAIKDSPAWQENVQTDTGVEESRAIRNAASFAARISKRFNVTITFTDSIEGGAQGKYENGKIVIDKNTATQGEVIKRVMVHELTHKAESSKWYGELRDALLDIGYGGDSEKLNADVQSRMRAYNDHAQATGSGRVYTNAEIEQEVVADLAGNLFTADEATIDRLVAKKPNLMQRVYETVRDFVRKLRGVKDPELDKIRNAEKLMRKALDSVNGETAAGQYAIVQDESNWPIVKADRDFVLSDDQKEWGKQINAYIRDVIRDKGQMVIKTLDGEEVILDAKSQRKAKDWMLNGDKNDNRIRKNASAHLDEVVEVSEDVAPGKPNMPDDKLKHDWSKDGWRYREAIFEDYNGKRYLLTLSVGVEDGNQTVYNIGDVREIEKKDPASVSGQPGRVPGNPAEAESSALPRQNPSDTIISENAPVGNRKYSLPSADVLNQEISAYRARGNRPATQTEMDDQRAGTQRTAPEMGERQFATQTAQRSEAMPDWLKQELMGNPQQRYYERDSNDAQLMRAWERYQQEGYDAIRDRLLRAESFTADDIADANMIMTMAFRNEDVGTALEIAKKYNTEGTKEGQTLQARNIFKRMTPTGIRTWAAGQAETRLAEHIETHSRQKRDVDAAAGRVAEKIRGMQSGDEVLRLNAAGTFTIDERNNRWGIPINEQQQALIDQYNLGSVARPGLFYNRATRKQRMLEAILATPNPLEVTGNGLNLIQRLEYMQDGEAVITNADLNYIGTQLAQYAAMDADAQQEREGDLALSRAYEAYGNITPATTEEKARTWRYISMLLSIPSAARNVIGNAAQNVVNATSHGIAVELDKLASHVTGQRTVTNLTLADRVNGWNAFADETVNTFRDFYTDRAITSNMHGDDRFNTNQRGRVYENQALETLRLAEGYLMSVGDRNFWKKAYVNSIAEQQRVAVLNGVELDMSEAAKIARTEANYATFNEDSSVRDLFSRLKQNPNFLIRSVADFIMPFTGVPTNITKRMIQYSPMGLLGTAVSRAYDAATGKNFDQKAFVTELSRGLTGSALFGLGMLLKEAGLIMLGTGDEDDSKVYGVRTAQGGQYSPYIRVGGEYISLSTFAPAVSALVMGATAVDLFKGDEDALTALYNASLAGLDQIFDASYLSSLQSIFTGQGSTAENLGTAVLNSAVSQNVPAVLGQLSTAMDPYVRDTKDKSVIMQALKSGLIAKIPGMRELLPEKVDVTGRSVVSKEGLRNFLDPFTTTKAADDAVLDELIRLHEETGESSFMPLDALSGSKNTLTVNKEKITLDGEDKESYKKRYGKLWYEGVSRLVSRPGYKRMSDEKKMEEISEIVKDAKKKASEEIAREIRRGK